MAYHYPLCSDRYSSTLKVHVTVHVVLNYYFAPLSFTFLDLKGWGISPRGAGYLFGSDVVLEVCLVVSYV